MWNAEKKYGSIIKGLFRTPKQNIDLANITSSLDCEKFIKKTMENSLYSFQNGLSTFTDALAVHLMKQPNITLTKNTKVDRINLETKEIHFQQIYKAASQKKLTSGDYCSLKDATLSQKFDHIISSIPSSAYPNITGLPLTLQQDLARIPYQDVIVTNFVFTKQDLPVEGFGFLIPSSQNMSILGVILDSQTLPEQDSDDVMRITVMQRRQYHSSQILFESTRTEFTNSEYIEKCWSVLKFLNLDKTGVVKVKVRKQINCIAQYIVGHDTVVEAIRNSFGDNLEVCGSSYDGVSINDCVQSGVNAANRILFKIKQT